MLGTLFRFLLFKLFTRHPVLAGLLLMGIGIGVVNASLDEVKEFRTFGKAKEIRGAIVSVKPADTLMPSTDITISWFDTGSRREGVINTGENPKIAVQRDGQGMSVEVAQLRKGDTVKILVSAKGNSVMFAPSQRLKEPPYEFLGMEATSLTLFGLALMLGGIGFLAFRKHLVLGQN